MAKKPTHEELEQTIKELEKEGAKRKQAEERTEHLILVLRAIRTVNQLITREKDRDKLLKGICDNLIETRGYYNAWIALINESVSVITTAEAGLGKDFLPMLDYLKRGDLTQCGRKALKQSEVVVTKDPLSTCTDCPLAEKYAGRGAMTMRLEYGGKFYGLLSASIPRDFVKDEEEQSLFQEVARDIAFALHNTELEEERKQAEQALRESEEKYRSLVESTEDSIYLVDRDCRYLFMNKKHLSRFGLVLDKVIGRSYGEFHSKEETREFTKKVNEIFKTGKSPSYEHRSQRDGGYYIRTLSPVKGPDGRVIAVTIDSKDITKRKRAEEALRTSQEYARNIIDSSLDMIITVDKDRCIVEFNKAAEETFGYHRDEVVGTLVDILYANPQEGLALHKKTVEQGQCVQEILNRRKNGEVFPSFLSASLLRDAHGELVGVMGVSRDITEHKRAEEALRKSEQEKAVILGTMSEHVVYRDTKMRVLWANGAAGESVGLAPEQLVGRYCYEIWHQRSKPCVVCPAKETLKTGQQEEMELTTPDGRIWWIRTYPIRDANGDIVGIANVAQEITERKRAEEALKESEAKYRELVQNANSIILRREPKGKITFFNEFAQNFFGYTEHEILGKNEVGTIVPRTDSAGRDLAAMIKDIGLHPERCATNENENMRRNGERVWVAWTNKAIRDKDGNIVEILSVGNDISERKRLESELQQSQKMEALGTLAGGIAHDLNNLLTVIKGNTSLMLLDVATSHPYYERLNSIEQAVQSAADLTRQLLGFSMGGKYEVKPTDMNELVKRTSGMFGRTKKEISVHTKYQEGIWPVEVDQGQIEQVLVNLYVNAWQAMPGGGDLYLETENVTLDEASVKPYDLEPGRYVKIAITDTGVGMDEATQQRIFDPFFTTKEMGRGTGLGLASVYGIIKNHDGIITVSSIKGEGTTFTMYLPASEKEVVEEVELPKEILRGTETVVLVDDEEMVLDVGEGLLKEMGYKVLIARSGKEAIEIVRKPHRAKRKAEEGKKGRVTSAMLPAPDIVILDMIMPVMGGGETYDRMKEINPEIKVLLSSGYSIDGQAQEILHRGCNGFIQKPFSMRQLSQEVRKILDAG